MNVRVNSLCTLMAATVAAGCGMSNAPGPLANAAPAIATSNVDNAQARGARLFVSDYGTLGVAGRILVYSLPGLAPIATNSNVGQPKGECSDNHGHVWVTADNPRSVPQVTYELNHDGSTIKTLLDPYGYPAQGCAWDPTTGDVAVTNINFACCSGNVLIYPGGSGTPRQVSAPGLRLAYFVGYDSRGNLFFDGEDLNYSFFLGELPKGASNGNDIDVSGGTIVWSGMVQSTVPGTLYVGDQNCKPHSGQQSCLHHLELHGSKAKITANINLLDNAGQPLCNMMQGVIWRRHLYGSDLQTCDSSSNATFVWGMPAGGLPQAATTQQEFEPYGAAISL